MAKFCLFIVSLPTEVSPITQFESASVSPPENTGQGEDANTDCPCDVSGDQWGEKDLTRAGEGIWCRESSSLHPTLIWVLMQHHPSWSSAGAEGTVEIAGLVRVLKEPFSKQP